MNIIQSKHVWLGRMFSFFCFSEFGGVLERVITHLQPSSDVSAVPGTGDDCKVCPKQKSFGFQVCSQCN